LQRPDLRKQKGLSPRTALLATLTRYPVGAAWLCRWLFTPSIDARRINVGTENLRRSRVPGQRAPLTYQASHNGARGLCVAVMPQRQLG
jgi:hypothetical protein